MFDERKRKLLNEVKEAISEFVDLHFIAGTTYVDLDFGGDFCVQCGDLTNHWI